MRPVFDQVSETREKDPSEILLCGSLREFHGTSDLLDIDFGLKGWNELDSKEIVRKYRQFVYETGAAERQESGVSLRPLGAYAPEGGQESGDRGQESGDRSQERGG